MGEPGWQTRTGSRNSIDRGYVVKSRLLSAVCAGVFIVSFNLSVPTPADTIAQAASLVQNSSNGHYYQLVELPSGINWYDARDAAAASRHNGIYGHLATVTSSQEDDFLVNAFPQLFPEYVWLGASDEQEEGTWLWITGEPWSYTNWDPGSGEPNGGTSENCLDYSDDSVNWNDESCGREINYYLVEYDAPRVVDIDIKPGSDPNAINVRSRGVIPVATLTTADFDATTVEPEMVQFSGASPVRWAVEDVDSDTDWDMIFHFKTQETGIACGDTEAALTGETFDGQSINGTDSIKTVGCKKQ